MTDSFNNGDGQGEDVENSRGIADECRHPGQRNEEDATEIPARNVYLLGFTGRQWLILSIFGISNMFSTAIIALQAPFYPEEAEAKGAGPAEYGFVFGSYQLTMFFSSPICGILLGRINPKYIFNWGILTAGTFTILFGFLHYINDHVTFIALSFVGRVLQGIGNAAFIAASFTTIALEFPDAVATAFACFEVCAGLGLFIGPLLGGVLFDLGGFPMPFVVIGTGFFVLAASVHFILPGIKGSTPEAIENSGIKDKATAKDAFGFFSLLAIPSVSLAACSVAVCSSTIGFLTATLEPHLRAHFGLSPTSTGAMFIIDAGVYAIFAPMWGKLCDKFRQPKIFTLLGSALTFIGFMFIGPAPFLNFDTILWVTASGLAIHGLGVGSTLVSAFVIAMQDAVSYGLPDTVKTYGMVSGLWVAFFALGCFIGPSVGGVLLEQFQFRLASLYVFITQAIIALCTLFFIIRGSPQPRKSSGQLHTESQPLLPEPQNLTMSCDGVSEQRQSMSKAGQYGAT